MLMIGTLPISKGKVFIWGCFISLHFSPRWYGEGDEKIWVDDDVFPSHFGTGQKTTTIVHGHRLSLSKHLLRSTTADKPFTRIQYIFQSRNLEGIPFKNKFQFDLEMLLGSRIGRLFYYHFLVW